MIHKTIYGSNLGTSISKAVIQEHNVRPAVLKSISRKTKCVGVETHASLRNRL